jgi:hypothetical protein
MRAPLLESTRAPTVRWLYASHLATGTGRGLILIAIPWLLIARHRTLSAVAILLLTLAVFDLLVGNLAGIAADRIDRRRLVIASEWLRLIPLGGMVLLLRGAGHLDLIAIAPVLAYHGLDRAVTAATFGLIVDRVPAGRRVRINSRLVLLQQLGNLLGALAAGSLLGAAPGAVFVICAAAHLLAGLAMARLRALPPAGSIAGRPSWRDLVQALRLITRTAELRSVVLGHGALFLALDLTNCLLPAFVMRALVLDAAAFGLIDAAWAAGALAAGGLLGFAIHGRPRRGDRWSLVAFAGALAVFSASEGLAGAVLGYAAAGFTFTLARVFLETRLQEVAPPAFTGRVRMGAQTATALLGILVFAGLAAWGEAAEARRLYQLGVVLMGLVAVTRLAGGARSDGC